MVPQFCDFCRLLWFQLLWIVFNKQLVPNALVQERISSYYLFLEPYEEILHQLSNNLYYLLSRVLLRTICFNISKNEEIKKESHENEWFYFLSITRYIPVHTHGAAPSAPYCLCAYSALLPSRLQRVILFSAYDNSVKKN
jgi:hypothetical protein